MVSNIIIALIVYWLIGTIIFIASKENSTFAFIWATGFIGSITIFECWLIRKIIYKHKRQRMIKSKKESEQA